MASSKTKFLILISTCVLFSVPVFAVAQTNTNVGSSTVQLISNVYIRNIVLTPPSSDNSIAALFTLGNGGSAQSGVKYGMEIMKIGTNGSETLVDRYISNEVVSLKEKDQLVKTLRYTPTVPLSGTYHIWLVAENTSGLPLTAAPAGKITLSSKSQSNYIEIKPTCSLSVLGEQGSNTYTPLQGIDILPSETLVATCTIVNHFTTAQRVTPIFETHYRTEYGPIVAASSDLPATSTQLSVGSTQKISFALPKPNGSQAYDVKVSLQNASSSVVSGPIFFHYVITGESATLQALSLDRTSYVAGDTAQASVLWAPSAGNFTNARNVSSSTQIANFMLKLVVSGDLGIQCGNSSKNITLSDTKTFVPISININCSNPSLMVSLTDAAGKLLDQKTFTFPSTSTPKTAKPLNTILWVLLILVLLGSALYLILQRRTILSK